VRRWHGRTGDERNLMQQFDARAVMAARITQECRPEDLRRGPPAAAAPHPPALSAASAPPAPTA